MKQLNLFNSPDYNRSTAASDINYWKLFVDGAARNNPGPAGIGIVILKNDDPVEQHGFFVGSKTNNQAEYLAFLVGLIRVKKLMNPNDLLQINSDSELLVRHLKGMYKVKNPILKPLFDAAQCLLISLNYDIGHILRHKNKQADTLANYGIDQQKAVPQDILMTLHKYGILL